MGQLSRDENQNPVLGGKTTDGDIVDAKFTDDGELKVDISGAASSDADGAWDRAKNTSLTNALQIKASAGRIRRLIGYSTTAQYIQVFNLASAPTSGSVSEYSFPIEANKPFSVDFGLEGEYFDTGIYVTNSTTDPTHTIGGSNTKMTASYK